MAVGFEKMAAGSLSAAWNDRTNPIDQIVHVMSELRGVENAPLTPQIFANAGIEYLEKYGGNPDAFDLIAEKSHNHSTLNPYAQFRMPATLEQVKQARKIVGPLTLLHCSPTSDGAGCAILASEDFVRKHGLMNQAVEIVAQALATDSTAAFDPKGQEKSCIQVAGFGMSQKAAQQVYQKAQITAKDIDVVELHDCFSANELVTYDALGLCPPGKAADFISSGKCTVTILTLTNSCLNSLKVISQQIKRKLSLIHREVLFPRDIHLELPDWRNVLNFVGSLEDWLEKDR
jgi:sterol carrier protein 2